MVEPYCKVGNAQNLKHSVFMLLDENPRLTAKKLCEILDLPYLKYANYMHKTRCEWKAYRENERGSNCSSVHAWHGRCKIPTYLDRELALQASWTRTKSKNRWLHWKEKLGYMMWFENGTVRLFVKSPVNQRTINQLIWNGFGQTGLIFDISIIDQVVSTVRKTESHHVFDVGVVLPRKKITYFEKKLGITIKLGDKSHPRAVEVESRIPDWEEKLNEL